MSATNNMKRILLLAAASSLCLSSCVGTAAPDGKTPAQPSIWSRLVSGIHLSVSFAANGQPVIGVSDSVQPVTPSGK